MDNEAGLVLSIIIPVHDMSGRLSNLESSIKSASHLPVHFVLVNDGDDPDTLNELSFIAKSGIAEVVTVNVRSPGLARNEGLKFVRAPWVTFWDSDDVGDARAVIEAINKVPIGKRAIIGAYIVSYVNSNGISKLRRVKNLNRTMINPGLWRFVFKREEIEQIRFPRYRMGEDQVFLAHLNLDEDSVFLSEYCFYTYFVGGPSQLTRDSGAIAESSEAFKDINRIVKSTPEIDFSILVLRTRILLTSFKYGNLGKFRALIELFALRGFPIKRKLRVYLASFYTVYGLLRNP